MRKILLLVGLLLPTIAWALPNEFVQEGLVFEDGEALDGAHDVTIRLYANEQGGEPLFEEAHEGTTFFDGYYAVSIGSIEELTASIILRPTLYLGISIGGGRELEPRTAIVKVPAAFVADVAENAVGNITPRTVSIGDALVIDENGQWVGDTTGLRGPPGPPGDGAAVDDVIAAIVAALDEDPDLLPFLRNTVNDSVVDSTITFDSSRLVFDFGGVANALDLGNNNIVNANSIRFNDPGPGEGVSWSGTQASIVVSTLGGGNTDGFLRLINDDGISLESNTRIQGNLTITGAIESVQSITTTLLTATTANITNANITTLNGPNGRVNVIAELDLAGNVRIGPNTNFLGVIRNDGGIRSGGDISGRNFTAAASISANGNITAGNRLVAGNGGIWVGNIQVFDGNGNLVRRPIYQCPNGQVMRGTDNNGVAQCVAISCPVGQYLRGIDGNNRPICAADTGLRSIPQRQCPPGQAATAISANGTITCGVPRAQPQRCEEGEFVVGLAANGSVICAEAPEGGGAAGGQCEPGDVRPNILVCTRSSRNVAQFTLPGFNFQIANGCDPTDQTQVMFVSRSGVGSVAPRAAAWRNYVNRGGLIITEFSSSDEVYNALFGTNVRQGSRRGSCRDNAMPVVKVNLEDSFWQINDDLQPTPANLSGCGYEVGAFPELVPLGGWAANQINVGYRDLGDGRVWIVDADWQDGAGITAASIRMMGLMATWCGGAGGDDGEEEGGLEFEGIRNNVPPAEIVGWRQCHRSLYNERGANVADITRQCDGDLVMYGCKATNAANWQVLAQGDRDAVFRDTGRGNAPTVNNGVGWYFSGTWSIGFAPAGQAITRNSCDTTNRGSNDRICWHSSGGTVSSGWRCGSSITSSNTFERVIWTKDAGEGGGDPEPPGDALVFQGIRQNVPDAALEGWRPCHTSRFNTTTNNLQNVVDNDCRGEQVMLGCRPVGSANWNLLAQGRHGQVFRDVGRGRNSVTRENGVDFYYSNSYSMGFVQAGTGVSRSSCDTLRNPGSESRMCWHTSANRMTSGYRCGNSFLNGNAGWERRIWVLEGGGGPPQDVFASCQQARLQGNRISGVYNLRPPGEQVRRVYCDMTTDGGGWTLVAASEGQTLNDQRSNYYNDLATLDPAGANAGVWWGLRALGNRWDMRFTCRDAVRAADSAMTVDLSVYDVPYYTEFTTGLDAQSCFSETNGRGDESPPPMRRNNLNGQVRARGDQWNAGYLEGEDSCGDTSDFTIDFDDRGMDSNQSDGTDWGEDDGSRKCGRTGLGTGQWFIFARERGGAAR